MKWFLLFIFLIGCESSPPPFKEFSGTVMTIDYRILTPSNHDEKVQKIITDTFHEVDMIYNKWNPVSEISKFNQSFSTEPHPLSHELKTLLELTDRIVQLSLGKFDPTIEPLTIAWKNGKMPLEEELSSIGSAIGWHHIHFSENSISKDHPFTQLDLGGIAKGYAVDLLFTRLQKAGFDPLYVEWGGEIRLSKSHPSGRAWLIKVQNPMDPDNSLTLQSSLQAIATSGDYEQNWTVKNEGNSHRYSHIIHPKTLSPLEIKPGAICSATCVADTCWLADGLATAACLFESRTEMERWMDQLKVMIPHLQFHIIERKYD